MHGQTQEALKIGFSFAKTSTANKGKKREAPEPDHRDYVTSIAGNQLTSLAPEHSSGPIVIPLSLHGVTKRSKLDNETPKPDAASTANEQPNPTPSPANKEKTLDEIAAEEILREARNQPSEVETQRILPIILQNQIEGIDQCANEEDRFRYDLDSRPDEADPESEAYENIPIEEFGFAMLRGMGWAPGKSIGLNNRGLVEPIEFVKRPGFRLGLGATPQQMPVKKKKYIKPGESREPAPIMVAPTGPDGRVRHVKSISEKLVPLKTGLQEGQLVGIVSGQHDGLYARIVHVGKDDQVVVRLESSSEEVSVSKSDICPVDLSKLSENHPALKFMSRDRKDESEQNSQKRESSSKSRPKSTSPKGESSSSRHDNNEKMWLRPRIMVRFISKSFNNGKYYSKKVKIVDVTGRNECVVQLDNGNLVENVKQRMLETVIPKPGGKVMVVSGPDSGRLGTLLDRKMEKEPEKEKGKVQEKEKAVVQLMPDLAIYEYPLDDVAQYVGNREEEAIDVSM